MSLITKGEKEVSKRRADVFFRLKQGEFITFADGKDREVRFRLPKIQRQLPQETRRYSDTDLRVDFERIYEEVKSIFQNS